MRADRRARGEQLFKQYVPLDALPRSWPPYLFGQTMPSQPRAASLRVNSLSNVPQLLARFDAGPLGSVAARNRRISARKSSTPAGKAAGSKAKLTTAAHQSG